MNQAGIIAILDKTLDKIQPLGRTVCKRTITRVGGDDLTGRPGTTTFVDVLLKPQPFYSRLGRQRVTGDRAKAETLISPSGKALLADDWLLLVSPTCVTIDDLSNSNVVFTMQDSQGIEVLRIIDFESASAFGGDCMYTVYVRSVKRPT